VAPGALVPVEVPVASEVSMMPEVPVERRSSWAS
jgi:hypothetical protein